LTNIVLLILQIVQLILLAVAFITVLWTAQAGKDAVMMRAPEFVLAFLIAHQIGLCAGLSLSQFCLYGVHVYLVAQSAMNVIVSRDKLVLYILPISLFNTLLLNLLRVPRHYEQHKVCLRYSHL